VNFSNLDRNEIRSTFTKSHSELKRLQQKETIKRYQFINDVLKQGLQVDESMAKDIRAKLDRVLTHKVWGYVIFLAILFLIFQSIFSWSTIPMDFIDSTFASLSSWTAQELPTGILTDLLSQGIIPGIGGVIIFIPQIAFLFLFISILEESGYMSRVVFLMDKIMRKFGLSGKSVVPLISGTACAIPAIMATRNIENWKERLITILVTPFTTCSARLPVYTIIISLVIPDERLFGILNMQGLALMLLYLLGFGTAILSAYILNKILKISSKTYFVVEMPSYKMPLFKNVGINVVEKTKAFVVGAGKIILAISVILWFLASFGPGENFNEAESIVKERFVDKPLTELEFENEVASQKLENSYIGIMGRVIEPAIAPLGYDWKIGIAIISSFAAREVFVGTLATIYSVGNSDNEATIKSKMQEEINPQTGKKIFNFASGISLLLFYAFAMQCASTLAITKKETNSWKWPAMQLVLMSGLAYFVALITYQLLK
jgi:ferrous iron transport protein B